MPSIFVSPKALESFNELRAVEGGKRKKLITQSEMFDEILEEYRNKR